MAHRWTVFLVFLATSVVVRANAQTGPLTYEQALERARSRAPLILSAQDRIAEARGRLLGAKVLLRDNPVLSFSGGPRYTNGSDLIDSEVGLSQSFELGGRRRSRIEEAQADVDREAAASRNTVRQLLGDVSIAFWQAVAAGEQVRVSGNANQVALELRDSMQKRYEAGDVAVLDLNIARTAAGRAQNALRRAESEQARALGELRILLGMTSSELLVVQGNLTEHNPYDLNQLIAEATKRPDLEATAAELRQAEADVQLGRGSAWPDVGLGFRYGRDEGDKIARGELSFTLPVFSRGQDLRATGEARSTRLRRELQAGRMAVANEVITAFHIQKN